jgi:hypothetical protein
MPIALEPGKRWPIVLDSDKGMNPEPTFYARALSMREQQRVGEVIDAAKEKGRSTVDVFTEHLKTLETVIIGWAHMRDANSGEMVQFNLDRLPDIVDFHECRELLSKVIVNGHVSHEEKKD